MSERDFFLKATFSKTSTADAVEKMFKELGVSFEKSALDAGVERVTASLRALNEESSRQFSEMYKEFGEYFFVQSVSRENESVSISGLVGSGSEDFIRGYLEILDRLECTELYASESCFDWFSEDGDGYEKYVYTMKNGEIDQTTEVVPFED
jgi:uncharacterized protein with GYD domain